jgi:hypothetical protein
VSNDPNFEELVIAILKYRDDSSVRIKSPAHGWAIGRDKGTLLGSWKDSEVARDVEALIPALEALDAAPWTIVGPDTDSNTAGLPSDDVGPAQEPINVGDDQTLEAPQVLFRTAFESAIIPQASVHSPVLRADTYWVVNAPEKQSSECRSSFAATPTSQRPQRPGLPDDLQQNIIQEPSYPCFHVPLKLPKNELGSFFMSTFAPLIAGYLSLENMMFSGFHISMM